MKKRIYYIIKNYDEFHSIDSEELNECDKCKMVMTPDQQVKKKDPNSGISYTMTCPKCGHEEFLIFKEVEA